VDMGLLMNTFDMEVQKMAKKKKKAKKKKAAKKKK
jgi:hypothetical protein